MGRRSRRLLKSISTGRSSIARKVAESSTSSPDARPPSPSSIIYPPLTSPGDMGYVEDGIIIDADEGDLGSDDEVGHSHSHLDVVALRDGSSVFDSWLLEEGDILWSRGQRRAAVGQRRLGCGAGQGKWLKKKGRQAPDARNTALVGRSRAASSLQRCAARQQDRGSKWSQLSPAGMEARLLWELDWAPQNKQEEAECGEIDNNGNGAAEEVYSRPDSPAGETTFESGQSSCGEQQSHMQPLAQQTAAASPLDLRYVGVKRASRPVASRSSASPASAQGGASSFPSMRTDPQRELAGLELASPFRSVLSPINSAMSPTGNSSIPRVRSFQAALLQGSAPVSPSASSSPVLWGGPRSAPAAGTTQCPAASPLAVVAHGNSDAHRGRPDAQCPPRKSNVYSVLTDLSAATIATENIVERVHFCLYTRRSRVSAALIASAKSSSRRRSCSVFDSSDEEEEDEEEDNDSIDREDEAGGEEDDEEIVELRHSSVRAVTDTTNYKSLAPKVSKEWLRKTLTPYFYFVVSSQQLVHYSSCSLHSSRSFGILAEASQSGSNSARNFPIGPSQSDRQNNPIMNPDYKDNEVSTAFEASMHIFSDRSTTGFGSIYFPPHSLGQINPTGMFDDNTSPEDALNESEDVTLARRLGKIIVPLYPKRLPVAEDASSPSFAQALPSPSVVLARKSPGLCSTPRPCASPSNDTTDSPLPREFSSRLFWTPTRPSGFGAAAIQSISNDGADFRNNRDRSQDSGVKSLFGSPDFSPEEVLETYIPSQLVVSMVEGICQADERVTSFSTQFLKALYRRCKYHRETILTALRRVVKARVARSMQFEAERSLLVHGPGASGSKLDPMPAACAIDGLPILGRCVPRSNSQGESGSSQPKRDHLLSVLDLLEFMISVPFEADEDRDLAVRAELTPPVPSTPGLASEESGWTSAKAGSFSASESLMIIVLDCLMCYGSGLGMGASADGIYEQPQQLLALTRCLDALVVRLPESQSPVWTPHYRASSMTGSCENSGLSGFSPANLSLNMSMLTVSGLSWTENGLNLIFSVLQSLLKRWPTGVGVGPCDAVSCVSHNAANSVREDAHLSLLGRLLCHPLVVNSVYTCCCYCNGRTRHCEQSQLSAVSPPAACRDAVGEKSLPRLTPRRDWDLQILNRCLFKLSGAVESVHFKVALRALDILCTSGLYSTDPALSKSQGGYNMYNHGVENPQLLFLYYLPSPSESIAQCSECVCAPAVAVASPLAALSPQPGAPKRAPGVCERRRALETKKSDRLDALVASLRSNRRHWNVSVRTRSEELMDFLMDAL